MVIIAQKNIERKFERVYSDDNRPSHEELEEMKCKLLTELKKLL